MGDTTASTKTHEIDHYSPLNFKIFKNTINNKLVDTGVHRQGVLPVTKETYLDVPVATKEDLDEAVNAAREAFIKWARTSVTERRQLLLDYADSLEKEKTGFVSLLTLEQGKPISAAEGELCGAIVRELVKLDLQDEVITDTAESRTTLAYTPIGVVGAIVPWNFPVMLAVGKIVPALLTGNTIILKSSPFTPYCGLKLAEVASRVFPPGVVQGLSGDDNLGPWITGHPGIDKISFTGSVATGKLVMASASKTLKRVTLELGGNDPAIICADVDIQKVAPKIIQFAFMNSGQVCLAIKRIYVHESIYAEFREALVSHAKNIIKVGDGSDPNTTHGPVQNKMQYDRVKGFFADIEASKLNVALGGGIVKDAKGYFITPTIVDNPPDDSRIVVEEPFGPIVPILSWKTEEEVIGRANNTRLGLGASVWVKDLATGERMARRLEAGSVWINNHFELSPLAPFGGVKESGLGVEWGVQGLKSFCNTQVLVLNKL